MTDQEITRLVAEKVMGWHYNPEGACWFDDMDQFAAHGQPYHCPQCHMDAQEWNPMTSDADACAVIDRLAEQEYAVGLHYQAPGYRSGTTGIGSQDTWEVVIMPPASLRPAPSMIVYVKPKTETWIAHGEPTPDGRRRAICLAALKAVGMDID